MNFINSILLFFAVLFLGPKMISEFDSKQSNQVAFADKDDPYDSTILIRGGTFAMGMNQENIMGDWNNNLRRVTVSSFRIDKYEVSNKKYRTYIHWLEKIFIPIGRDSIVRAALPDTSVWRTELSYNDPMVEGYFRSNAFNDYPVVGVTWEQANNYCRWRTDRANENTLIKYKLIDPKNPYDTIIVPDLDHPDRMIEKVIKHEAAEVKNGTWTYYSSSTGDVVKTERFIFGQLEKKVSPPLVQQPNATKDTIAKPVQKPLPKAVQEYEKTKKKGKG